MIYTSVLSAVVRALAAETINSAGGCDFEPKIQAAKIAGENGGRAAAFVYDCMVFSRLHTQLSVEQWSALVAKYSTHVERKHAAIELLCKRVKSPAPRRFSDAATVTWAMPRLPGIDGKRSTNVLPAAWYDMANWDDDGRPEPTLYRWRSGIRKDLERMVNEGLSAAQEILDAEGLIRCEVA